MSHQPPYDFAYQAGGLFKFVMNNAVAPKYSPGSNSRSMSGNNTTSGQNQAGNQQNTNRSGGIPPNNRQQPRNANSM